MILYGFGGHARVLLSVLEEGNSNNHLIVDDNEIVEFPENCQIISKAQMVNFYSQQLIISIGDNRTRKEIYDSIEFSFGNIFSKFSIIDSKVRIGKGTVILQRAILQRNVIIGENCIINTGSIIEHDTIISNHVHVGPGAILCGGVEIGEGSFIGAGAIVLPGLKIGAWSTIGAGSVITKNITHNLTVAGNPAKRIF